MPILTTLRMRLPVWPVHAPDADLVRECRHPVENLMHLGDDVLAVDLDARLTRSAQAPCEARRVSPCC